MQRLKSNEKKPELFQAKLFLCEKFVIFDI